MTAGVTSDTSLHEMQQPRSVLVVVTRRIGDVLLATPLVRSLKLAWPGAAIDALVFEGTEGAIAANPDFRQVLTIPARPGWWRHARFLLSISRRHDLALSLVPGDRPTCYAWIAGRSRIGLLLNVRKERWKRRLLDRWVPFDDLDTHTVRMHLALADALGVPSHGDVVVTWTESERRQVDEMLAGGKPAPVALLHPYPKFNYKMWHRQGWIELAHWLGARGYLIALSGGPDPPEREYVSDLAFSMPDGTINAAGRLTFGASACLASRACIYVGPDTAMTHVAAALGVPTVALFGPSNPVKWGPWPRNHGVESNPWQRQGSQCVGNVTLLQGSAACVPCLLEGCGRHLTSFSDCLQHLPASRVIAAVARALDGRQVPGCTMP
jgi:heptosyltransferase-3